MTLDATQRPVQPEQLSSRSRPIELAIGGMTCASCAARVEKRLNKIDGVQATVNYATEKATVRLDEQHDSDSNTGSDIDIDSLISAVKGAGYTATVIDDRSTAKPEWELQAQQSEQDELRARVVISAVIALPVVVLAMSAALHFAGWQWVCLALATPIVTWGAWPLHRATLINARHRATTMDTLVSLGITTSFLWSVSATVTGKGDSYFEIAVVLTVFILLGRYFEARARFSSGAALRALLDLGAKDVAVLRGTPQAEHRIPIADLQVGDLFVVRPGEKIATDGAIESGHTTIDTSLLTGESVPVEADVGTAVTGATINLSGRVTVRANRVGADTQLAQIGRLVEKAQSGKAEVQRLADRVSAIFVPVVIALALLTFMGWLLAGQPADSAMTAAVAVLIIACPCALGLATPTALLVGTGRGAQLGIVIRGPQVLESTRRIDTIVLDKTGTVTTGKMQVHQVLPVAGVAREDLIGIAGALEDASAHPIARAITAYALAQPKTVGGHPPQVSGFADSGGLGVAGMVDGRAVVVGRRRWLADEWAIPGLTDVASNETRDGLAELIANADSAERHGLTPVWVGWDGSTAGIIVVGDAVRATSARAVAEFRALGMRPILLTGDNVAAAHAVAAEVGIDPTDVIAEVLPSEKAMIVTELTASGRTPAMVGDGVNDAAALAAADLGLAISSGSDVAVQAADLTLMRDDLLVAADAVRLSRATLGVIQANLFWAFGYNVAAIPLAAFGLLNPMIAGAAMAFSSVFVVGNSLRLRRFRPLAR
ncbi:heavy metal translocating P-type ATPase [Jatrophihabitans sp. DSM 45814]